MTKKVTSGYQSPAGKLTEGFPSKGGQNTHFQITTRPPPPAAFIPAHPVQPAQTVKPEDSRTK